MNRQKLFFSLLTAIFFSGLLSSVLAATEKEGCQPTPMTAEEYDDLYGGD